MRASGCSSPWDGTSTAACSARIRSAAGCRSARTGARLGTRPGIEEHLEEAGFRYFFTDAHLAHAGASLGAYGDVPLGAERFDAERHAGGGEPFEKAVRTPYRAYRVSRTRPGVAALVRDPRSSHAGLEPAARLSRRRVVPRVPQDPLARRPQAVAGHRRRRRARGQAALRARTRARARRRTHGSSLRGSAGGLASAKAALVVARRSTPSCSGTGGSKAWTSWPRSTASCAAGRTIRPVTAGRHLAEHPPHEPDCVWPRARGASTAITACG